MAEAPSEVPAEKRADEPSNVSSEESGEATAESAEPKRVNGTLAEFESAAPPVGPKGTGDDDAEAAAQRSVVHIAAAGPERTS